MDWNGVLNRPTAAADLLSCIFNDAPFNLLFLSSLTRLPRSQQLSVLIRAGCVYYGRCLCTLNVCVYKVRVLSAFLFWSISFCLRLSAWKSIRVWACVSWEVNVSAERGTTQQEREQERSNVEMINSEINIDNDKPRQRSSQLQAFWMIPS